MGKYDGILICSDFDETLAPRQRIPEINKKAIKHFQDNGGCFTLISGRPVNGLSRILDGVTLNTYVGGCNGAIISKLDGSDVIFNKFITDDIKNDFLMLINENPQIEHTTIFFDFSHMSVHRNYFNDRRIADLVHSQDIHKVCLLTYKGSGDDEKEKIEALAKGRYLVTRASSDCIELQNFGVCKGNAARKIADAIGAHTLVCIGDYENDISMVAEADIGYAVENACDSLKAVADRITVNATDGALAAIIEELG